MYIYLAKEPLRDYFVKCVTQVGQRINYPIKLQGRTLGRGSLRTLLAKRLPRGHPPSSLCLGLMRGDGYRAVQNAARVK